MLNGNVTILSQLIMFNLVPSSLLGPHPDLAFHYMLDLNLYSAVFQLPSGTPPLPPMQTLSLLFLSGRQFRFT